VAVPSAVGIYLAVALLTRLAGAEVLDACLRHARVSRAELWSQLRQAGVVRRDQVQAVVMETTGE
jgi:uncharacterized membrane protein YcaP (DUF421 family)